MEQEIRFLEVDEFQVACAVSGEGPVLVLPCWWVGDIERQLDSRAFRSFIEDLSSGATVVRYDRPGTGLSGGPTLPSTLDAERRVLEGVVEKLDHGPVALLGASCGGCSAIALAATRTDLVDRLILYGAYTNGDRITTPDVMDSLTGLIRAHWGLGSAALADVFIPDADRSERDAFTRYQRRVATGNEAAERLELVYRLDASNYVEGVRSPTLVLHRRGDRAIPFDLGRELASRIPDARFVPLRGRDHFPWIGQTAEMVRHVRDFLGVHTTSAADAPADSPLSEREREVLVLVAQGLSDAQIAEQLVVSPHTVHRHVANLRRKLEQPSRAAAVAEAARLGLI